MKQIILLIPYLFLNAQDIQRTQVIMGTFVNITVEKKDRKEITKGFKLLKNIEKSLSSYDKQSLLYQLNKNKKVKSDAYLLEAIQKSQKYYKQSNGYFNIAIGSVTKELYHFGEEEQVPSKEALNKANTQLKGLHINEKFMTLDENTTLDLGGMGKGYGVDKVAEYYAEQNISHATIALSGDIRCLHFCTFELQSPYSEQTFARLTAKILQLSISTSGTYRRFVQSQEHHHLINPKTLKQGRAFLSVSLFTKENNTKIDAYATAISVMPKESALAFLKEHEEIGFVLVTNEGKVLYGNLEKFVSIQWLEAPLKSVDFIKFENGKKRKNTKQ